MEVEECKGEVVGGGGYVDKCMGEGVMGECGRYKELQARFPHLKRTLNILNKNYKENDVEDILKKLEEDEPSGNLRLETLKFINYFKITYDQLIKIAEILIKSGKDLPYEEYSRFYYRYLSFIEPKTKPSEYKTKHLGYFD